MKKSFFTLLLVALATVALNAQITIKPMVGFNTSKLNIDQEGVDVSGKFGFQFGGSVMFGNKLYLEPGIQFLQTQSEVDVGPVPASEFDPKQKLSSIRIPVRVGYHLMGEASQDDMIKVRVFGGPSAAFITGVDGEIDKDDLKTASWGLGVGAGIDIWKLYLDVSHDWGLNNILDAEGVDADTKNNVFFVEAGIRITL